MDQTTNFANSKKRMIRMSPKGVPFVMTTDGKKQYSPKAAFKKTPDGGLRKLVKSNSVPNKIAPAMLKGRKVRANKGTTGVRKPRSNKGVARGPREATLYRMIFNGKMNDVPRAPSGRKIRSNKGMARGARPLITSPGGTTYKGMGAATRRRGTKVLKGNPFAALLNA